MGATTYRQQMRRCGNPACARCRDGAGHGPYWYAYYRDENGRLRSRYCGKTRPAEAVEGPGDRTRAARSTRPQLPPPLRIRLLGGLAVERGAVLLSARDWPRASARKLLALLALHPAGLSREEACEALWPEHDGAETALKTALSTLRRVLEPPEPSIPQHSRNPRLPPWERHLRLHLLPDDWLDVRAFTATADPGRLPLSALTGLVSLYTGNLLPEYLYEEWTGAARESLRSRWHALSLHLAQQLVAAGHEATAVGHLEALLADDGTQEEAARLLMTILAGQGRRDRALHVFQRLTTALEQDLSVVPDHVSRALAERLRRGAGDPAPVRSPRESAEQLKRRIAHFTAQPASPETARRLARLWAERALVLESLGEPQEALSSVESGRIIIDNLDFPAEECRLLLAEALILYRQGQARPAHDAAIRAGRLAAAAAERGMQAWALRIHAQALEALGSPEQAIAVARSSVAIFDTMGVPAESLRSRRVLAFALWRAGRCAEALTQHRHNLDGARDLGQPEQSAYVLCGLGQTLLTLGDLDAAEPHLQEALTLAARLQDHYLILSVEYHLANLWAERAYLASETGGERLLEARQQTQDRFERVMELARAHSSHHMLIGAAIDLAVSFAQWGETRRARPLIAMAEQMLAVCRPITNTLHDRDVGE